MKVVGFGEGNEDEGESDCPSDADADPGPTGTRAVLPRVYNSTPYTILVGYRRGT
jgi:hypothetical protein